MVATAAFVIGFLSLGLTVVLLAMRGGPRGVRAGMHGQSRTSRRGWAVALTVAILAFGVGVPVLVGSANGDKKREAVGGVKLTAAQASGRKVFAKNCATCHTLAATNSVGKVGPNLDQLRPPPALTLNAIKLGRARGNGQMPAELIDGQDAKNVASFLAAVAGH